jgi:uncharacterized BrkB/YihY/UPF0761 family membrane protein
MAQEPSPELTPASPIFAKSLKLLLLVGAALGILAVVLQIVFTPTPSSVFSSQDRPHGSDLFVLLLQIHRLLFSLPLQTIYFCYFVGLLISRPNHRNAWICALLAGFAAPVLLYHSMVWIVGGTVPP